MRIRELFPSETALVAQFYREAPDYWLLAEGRCDPPHQAQEFFTDAPPNCDPSTSDRLGLFLNQRLSGVAEVSYGFPEPNDAYLGLMMIGPWAQGKGHGRSFLAHAVALARKRHAPRLTLPSGRQPARAGVLGTGRVQAHRQAWPGQDHRSLARADGAGPVRHTRQRHPAQDQRRGQPEPQPWHLGQQHRPAQRREDRHCQLRHRRAG